MINPLLNCLLRDDFASTLIIASTPGSARTLLRHSDCVQSIRDGLSQGTVSESSIRQFVQQILVGLRVGERFVHDTALAGLAVVLERRPTRFAEEYLRDLASLHLAEMSMSVRVARECLKHRSCLPVNRVRLFRGGRIPTDAPPPKVAHRPLPARPLQIVRQTRQTAMRASFTGMA